MSDHVTALADTYNALMNIKTNAMIGVLTIFTAITSVLTLISGIYGMNIDLPLQNNTFAFVYIMIGMLMTTGVFLWIFKKRHWL